MKRFSVLFILAYVLLMPLVHATSIYWWMDNKLGSRDYYLNSKEYGSSFYWYNSRERGSLYYWNNSKGVGSKYYWENAKGPGTKDFWNNGKGPGSKDFWFYSNERGSRAYWMSAANDSLDIDPEMIMLCMGKVIEIEVCDGLTPNPLTDPLSTQVIVECQDDRIQTSHANIISNYMSRSPQELKQETTRRKRKRELTPDEALIDALKQMNDLDQNKGTIESISPDPDTTEQLPRDYLRESN